MSRRAASSPTPPTGRSRWPPSRCRAGCYVATSAAGFTPRLLESPGPVVDPRPDPTGARVAYVSGGALHVHDAAPRTTTVLAAPESRHRHLRPRRVHRGRGDGPDARLLVVPRTESRCWSRGWTTQRCSAGTSPTRPTRTGRPRRSPTPPPARRTPRSRWRSSASTARASTSTGTPPATSTSRTWCGRPRAARSWCSPATSARCVCCASTRPPARPRSSSRTRDPRLGRHRPRRAGAHRVGRTLLDRRPATTRGGCSSTASPSRRRRCRSAPCSTSTTTPCCSPARTSPTSTGCGRGRAVDGLRCRTPEPGMHAGRLAGGTLLVTRQSLDAEGDQDHHPSRVRCRAADRVPRRGSGARAPRRADGRREARAAHRAAAAELAHGRARRCRS